MGKIFDAASVAWYEHLFSEVHKKEAAAEAAGDDKVVPWRWEEYSAILKKEEERKKKLFPQCESWDFSKERSMKVVYKNEELTLRPYCDADLHNYVKVKAYYAGLNATSDVTQTIFKVSAEDKDTFICVVEDSTSKVFMGYVAINDTSRTTWELGIELLPEYCGKGYGETAAVAFLQAVKAFTGISEYRAFVEADNYPSQKLMRKINAKFVGLFDIVFGDEDAAREFENQNIHLITPEIEKIAKKLNVEPKRMLSKVLDYRIVV